MTNEPKRIEGTTLPLLYRLGTPLQMLYESGKEGRDYKPEHAYDLVVSVIDQEVRAKLVELRDEVRAVIPTPERKMSTAYMRQELDAAYNRITGGK